MVTLAHYQNILDSAGERYHILRLQESACALITQRGGRVLGVFPTPDAENLLWTNGAAFADADAFRLFVAEGGWNLGGERIWIAPEIQYNVRDRNDFWGTLHVPPQMDPGSYSLDVEEGGVSLKADLMLTAHNLAQGEKALSIWRRITPTPNPLRHLSDFAALMTGAAFVGYQQDVLMDEHNDTSVYSEAWNLVQLKAGGQLYIPCSPRVEASDYFGSVPEAARTVQYGDAPHIKLDITGKRQYKLGYKAPTVGNRIAYHQVLENNSAVLMVRDFFNDLSNVFAEEPPHLPGVNGHAIHVYNDGGEFGGADAFGEMECTGQTIGKDTWDSVDSFKLWTYVGTPDAVRSIAHLLLGIKL